MAKSRNNTKQLGNFKNMLNFWGVMYIIGFITHLTPEDSARLHAELFVEVDGLECKVYYIAPMPQCRNAPEVTGKSNKHSFNRSNVDAMNDNKIYMNRSV